MKLCIKISQFLKPHLAVMQTATKIKEDIQTIDSKTIDPIC